MPILKRHEDKTQERKYITRNKAVRYLKVSLAEFRKICIVKGVFPQVPPTKFAGNTTYYLKKDIAFVSHDPLIQKLRDIRANAKHAKKLEGRGDPTGAKLMRARTPLYSLDHVITERYPTFEAALRDLDDALSLVFLFANLSADTAPAKVTANCARLAREWSAFVAATGSLVKAFASVKGFYYQAVVGGIPVTWLVPHKFQLAVPEEVDLRVLSTFSELYQTLVGFVLYRLYTVELKHEYPPSTSDASDYMLHLVNHLRAHIQASALSFPRANGLPFQSLRVYVSREVPREPAETVLLSGGADILTLSATQEDVTAAPVTHCIVDRPPHNIQGVAGSVVAGRDYVQPQWMLDSLNTRAALPVADYRAGAVLPAHVSPFLDDAVVDEDGGYVPARVLELQQYAREHADACSADAAELSVAAVRALQPAQDGQGPAQADTSALLTHDLAARLAQAHALSIKMELGETPEPQGGEESASDVDKDDVVTLKPSTLRSAGTGEEQRLRMAMLTRRKQRIYNRMVASNTRLSERCERLEHRRREIEEQIRKKRATLQAHTELQK